MSKPLFQRFSRKTNQVHENGNNGGTKAKKEPLELDKAASEEAELQHLIGPRKNKKTAAEIIGSLEERFYDDKHDPVPEILREFTEIDDPMEFDGKLESKLNHFDIIKVLIDRKLSQNVFSNYSHFVDGLRLIGNINNDLNTSDQLAKNSMNKLNEIGDDLTLSIFASLQKTQRFARILVVEKNLSEISSLLQKEREIEKLLNSSQFLPAIQLYQESLSRLASSGMTKYTALDDLRKRFLRSADLINSKIKDRFVYNFKHVDENSFGNLAEALYSLGEIKVLPDLLRKYLPLAVDACAIDSVIGFIKPEFATESNEEEVELIISAARFKELCGQLSPASVSRAFLTLISEYTELLISFDKISTIFSNWVQEPPEQFRDKKEVLKSFEASSEFLKDHPSILWNEIQTNVTTFVNFMKFTVVAMPFEDFLVIIQAASHFAAIGDSFSKVDSDNLNNLVIRKGKEYANNFFQTSFDAMKIALERERFIPLSIPDTFKLTDIPEFSAIESPEEEHIEEEFQLSAEDIAKDLNSRWNGEQAVKLEDPQATKLIEMFKAAQNPFITLLDQHSTKKTPTPSLSSPKGKDHEKEALAQMTSEKLESIVQRFRKQPTLSQDSIEAGFLTDRGLQKAIMNAKLLSGSAFQSAGTSNHEGFTASSPIVTPSSYLLLTLAGNYISLMRTVSYVVSEASRALYELFEFYFFSLFTSFGQTSSDEFFYSLIDSERFFLLRSFLTTIQKKVDAQTFGNGRFKKAQHQRTASTSTTGAASSKLFSPLIQLRSSIDLLSSKHNFAIFERIIALESLYFLSDAFEVSQKPMQTFMIPSEAQSIAEFSSNFQTCINQFESFLFRQISPLIIANDFYTPVVKDVSWEKTFPVTTPSTYVSTIISILRTFKISIQTFGNLPPFLIEKLWRETVNGVTSNIFEVYATVIRCSDSGREQMALDIQSLTKQIEKLSGKIEGIRWDEILDFIQAYHYDTDEWEVYVHNYPQVNLSHILQCAQLKCGAKLERRERKEWLVKLSRIWSAAAEAKKEGKWEKKEMVKKVEEEPIEAENINEEEDQKVDETLSNAETTVTDDSNVDEKADETVASTDPLISLEQEHVTENKEPEDGSAAADDV